MSSLVCAVGKPSLALMSFSPPFTSEHLSPLFSIIFRSVIPAHPM